MTGRVVESHLTLGLIVGCHDEGDDGQLSKARSHRQDLSSVGVFVDVFVVSRVLHASGVPTNDVVGGASCDTGLEKRRFSEDVGLVKM